MMTTAIVWGIAGLIFGFLLGMCAVFAFAYKEIKNEYRAEMDYKSSQMLLGLKRLREAIDTVEAASDAND